jgi:DNA-binding winged helix-turn-helix (wHTH) protein
MWDDKTKLLLVSYNNHFLKEHVADLNGHFDIQRANSEQIAFFLIREADINLVIVDTESPLSTAAHSLRQAFGYNIGLVGVGNNTRSSMEAAFKSNCDIFVPRDSLAEQISFSCFALKKRLERTNQVEQRKNPGRKETKARIKIGPLEIFPKDYTVHYQEKLVRTTPTQFKLLLSFVSKTDELLTREWLQENIWDNNSISHRSIDAHISKLKKLLPALSGSLINIYGKGYMLSAQNLVENNKELDQYDKAS